MEFGGNMRWHCIIPNPVGHFREGKPHPPASSGSSGSCVGSRNTYGGRILREDNGGVGTKSRGALLPICLYSILKVCHKSQTRPPRAKLHRAYPCATPTSWRSSASAPVSWPGPLCSSTTLRLSVSTGGATSA